MARFTKALVAKELEARIRMADKTALYAYRDYEKADSPAEKEAFYGIYTEDIASSFALRNLAEALGFKVVIDDETCERKVLVD